MANTCFEWRLMISSHVVSTSTLSCRLQTHPRPFYERFGFVRVGAVCRYGINNGRGGASASQAAAGATETDIVGYRHWTYANERNLDTYGGPSYMMALRLPSDDSCRSSTRVSRVLVGSAKAQRN